MGFGEQNREKRGNTGEWGKTGENREKRKKDKAGGNGLKLHPYELQVVHK